MTLSEQLCILSHLMGRDFKGENMVFTDSNGRERQLIAISGESNGEIFVTLKDIKSRKVFDTSLKVYNPATNRVSYDHELIKNILRVLGRKRVREIKESLW